jgi:quercetin dioxygenase-like cupin family protein
MFQILDGEVEVTVRTEKVRAVAGKYRIEMV